MALKENKQTKKMILARKKSLKLILVEKKLENEKLQLLQP